MASPIQISVNQLSRLVGTHKAPLLLDVRTAEDFHDDPRVLPAAVRCPFPDVLQQTVSLVQLAGSSTVVVYCQKGLKISEGVAAALRAGGCRAEVLESGHFGWRDANQLMVSHNAIENRNDVGQSMWVTRVRPKVDRIACAWLIKRFVDRDAQFLFVTGSQVMAVAERFNATPFDIEDVFFSHRGEECTFDTMLKEFGLQSTALQRLAMVVRGADTDRLDLAPQCAGLMAASLGLSRMYDDDIEQLEAGMLIYDAMYRWARDAFDEKHDWPANVGKAGADKVAGK